MRLIAVCVAPIVLVAGLVFVCSAHAADDGDSLAAPVIHRTLPPQLRDEARLFQGISSLEVTGKNRLWVTWYTGGTGENRDNVVMIATSGDGGQTWSKPLMAIDPPGIVRAFDPSIWQDPQGRLWVFWAQGEESTFNPTIWDGRAGLWCIVTDHPEAGEKAVWSEPRRLCDGIMMCKPIVDKTGRWLLPVSIWNFPSKYDCGDVKGANVFVSSDQGKTFTRLGIARVPQDAFVFDEHNLIEKKDESLWLLARTKYGIGEAFSSDRGKTWTDVAPSKTLKHCSSRFFIRRLQSGNLLLVKNGPANRKTDRSELTAMISEDDGQTWSTGLVLDERSNVSYPDGNQAPDGTIYVTYDYSRYDAKEIYVARFTEADVKAGKIVTPSSRLKIVTNKATGKRIRILCYNICNTKGMDNKRDAQRVANVIVKAKPDVVALQELDRCTKRSEGVDVLADLAKRTGMIGTYGAAIEFQGGHYGIGILSKKKPVSSKTIPLPGKEEKRCFLVVEFDDYVLCCTHFSLTPDDRVTSAKLICNELKQWKKPVFVAGDFNATPDSLPIQTMQNVWATLSSDEFTWSSVKPDRRIDYIFGAWPHGVASDSPIWNQSILDARVIDEKIASDHRPFYVDFNLGFLQGNAKP